MCMMWGSNPTVKLGDLLPNSGWPRRAMRMLPNVGLEPHVGQWSRETVCTRTHAICVQCVHLCFTKFEVQSHRPPPLTHSNVRSFVSHSHSDRLT